jgi:mannitol/fructose-specific phosphotransferase system IIA component
MKSVKVLIQLPVSLKAQLDALRTQGYTINGYIRSVLERELKKGR